MITIDHRAMRSREKFHRASRGFCLLMLCLLDCGGSRIGRVVKVIKINRLQVILALAALLEGTQGFAC